MRVVLDCRSVFAGMGGIGRATDALARHLPAALGPGDELVLLRGSRRPAAEAAPAAEGRAPDTQGASDEAAPLPRASVREVEVDAAMLDPVFEQARLPGLLADLRADVYHGTCFAVPIVAPCARVATVHDVVFRRRPDLVDEPLRGYLERWTRVSCALAEAVVTVSRFSRAEIAACYGRAQAAVTVVPNAVDARFHAVARRPASPPFVLYVGALEAKKNVPALLAAFAELTRAAPDLPHHLVLAGGAGGQGFDVEAALRASGAPRDRVAVLGHVPDERLLELYGAADAFCYLSSYEGYGLPPLEAMASGVGTVVADRASLPEVTGGAALLVDPADPAGVAATLARLLRDSDLRADLVRRGRDVARATSWERSATRLAAVYRSAARLATPDRRAAAPSRASSPEPALEEVPA